MIAEPRPVTGVYTVELDGDPAVAAMQLAALCDTHPDVLWLPATDRATTDYQTAWVSDENIAATVSDVTAAEPDELLEMISDPRVELVLEYREPGDDCWQPTGLVRAAPASMLSCEFTALQEMLDEASDPHVAARIDLCKRPGVEYRCRLDWIDQHTGHRVVVATAEGVLDEDGTVR